MLTEVVSERLGTKPAQGMPFNALILKANLDKDAIWGNIPVIYEVLHNLFKAEYLKSQQQNETTQTKLKKMQNKGCHNSLRVDPHVVSEKIIYAVDFRMIVYEL